MIKQTKEENDKMWKNFEVKGICRLDLVRYIGEKKALKISDARMENIASKLGDALQDPYWISLEVILDWQKDEIDN